MNKEDSLLVKRFEELSHTAYHRGIPTYTSFLSLHEQNLLLSGLADLSCKYELIGGYSFAERKMACFFDFEIPDNHPYSILRITNQNPRFAEELSHRDYLGALMNLGIEREVIGDIITSANDSFTYIVCKSSMADYIIENYLTVRHTSIECSLVDEAELSQLDIFPRFEEIVGSVSSLRLDCILALAFKKSRTQVADAIKAGTVYVNSRLIDSTSYQLKENDTVSMRGYGKFIYRETGGLSKKGKTYIKILKYI